MRAVSLLAQSWHERGFGVDIEDSRRLTSFLWADNFWLCAESRTTLTLVTSELIAELQKVDLQLKPDALCFLTTSKDEPGTPLTVPLPPADPPVAINAPDAPVPVSEP
eukprot:13386748-Alexandrium_andersonii.AAC.1